MQQTFAAEGSRRSELEVSLKETAEGYKEQLRQRTRELEDMQREMRGLRLQVRGGGGGGYKLQAVVRRGEGYKEQLRQRTRELEDT